MIKKSCMRIIAVCVVSVLMFSFSGCKESKKESVDSYVKVSEDNIDLKGRTVKVDTISESFIPKEDISGITDEKQKKLNNVMLARQKEVESKFNCKIEWKAMEQNDLKQIYQNMKNGNYDSDIVYLHPYFNGTDMINENLIAPLDEYIDFDSGIYSSGQEVSIWKGKHYGINFANMQPGQYLTYNKTMILNEGLSDPYELMQKGQWTWDVFLDMVKRTTKDTNGDKVTDSWGIEGNYTFLYTNFLHSNNGDYISEDGNKFKYSLDLPEAKEALNFVTDLYKTNNVVLDYSVNTNTNYSNLDKDSNGNIITFFRQSKVAFSTNDYGKNDEFETARVCYPKGPKASRYMVYQTAGNFYAIPASVKDVKSVAVVMANLFSYFDTSKEEYITYEEIGIDELFPSDLKEILQKDVKYSWFVYDYNFNKPLNEVFQNILIKNKSVDDALNSVSVTTTNLLNKLNQTTVQ